MPSEGHIRSNLTRNDKRKHVRRIQRELPLFRHQVHELELQLKRIKLQKTSPSITNNTRQFRGKNSVLPIWNAIADRQFKERLKAEHKQGQLLKTQTEMAQWSDELQKLLQKCADNGKKVTEIVECKTHRRLWYFSMHKDDEVYTEQLAHVARLRLVQLQTQLQKPDTTMYWHTELSMGQDVAKLEPNSAAGIVLEANCGAVLPFSLDVAVDAYWRFFRFNHLDRQCFDHELDYSTDTFARSFSTRMYFEGFDSDIWGKYTCRRYISEDGVTLVWCGMWNISKFGGTKLRGMQLHKQGSITLSRVARQGSGQQSTATVVETRFETTPVFHEGIVDTKEQTQAFVTSLTQSYTKANNAFCTIMSELLLEEDWKATFGCRAEEI